MKKKTPPKKAAKSAAARMGMTEAEHRAMHKGGKGTKSGKPMKRGGYGGY